jgi:hypothetical protein
MSNADDFFGGGSKSATFETMNVPVGGPIVHVGEQRQQRDLDGNPKFWDKEGREPMMQVPIEVQTDLRDPADPADTGIRTLYVKGDMKRAIAVAVRAAGQIGAPRVGGTLQVAWTSSEAATRKGYNDKKIYTARYTAPGPGDSFFDQPQAAPAVPVQQAAPAPQPVAVGAPSSDGRPW